MKVTYATRFLATLPMLRRPLCTEGVERTKTHRPRGASMRTRMLPGLVALGIAASAVALTIQVRAQSTDRSHAAALQTATGQYVTATAPSGAVQQFLNPGLPAYPNFVAGEAVRSQLSPDGKTLAILCAGQNSLVMPNGNTDVANSTQFIFLYDVSGAHRRDAS
jgi:hypothetical protein